MTQRHDGRANDEMRSIQFERGFTCHAEGSVLVSVGRTKVLCTASVSPTVPKFLNEKNEGWVTAEYGLAAPLNRYAPLIVKPPAVSKAAAHRKSSASSAQSARHRGPHQAWPPHDHA